MKKGEKGKGTTREAGEKEKGGRGKGKGGGKRKKKKMGSWRETRNADFRDLLGRKEGGKARR